MKSGTEKEIEREGGGERKIFVGDRDGRGQEEQ